MLKHVIIQQTEITFFLNFFFYEIYLYLRDYFNFEGSQIV